MQTASNRYTQSRQCYYLHYWPRRGTS